MIISITLLYAYNNGWDYSMLILVIYSMTIATLVWLENLEFQNSPDQIKEH